jgi:hypothetical protein
VNQLAGSITNQNSHVGDVVNGGAFSPDILDGLKSTFDIAAAEDTSVDVSTRSSAGADSVEDSETVFESLKAAASPGATTEAVEAATFSWKEMLSKYGPKVRKACLAFAETALLQYVDNNPLIAGVISAIKTLED